MPVNEPVVVEKLTEDDVKETLNPGSTELEQTSRFYPGKVIKIKFHFQILNTNPDNFLTGLGGQKEKNKVGQPAKITVLFCDT